MARRENPRYKQDGTLSKIPDVYTECASCGELFKDTDTDHIDPVGKEPDWPPNPKKNDWNVWLSRLHCSPENLQQLCRSCHKIKTKKDREKGATD